MPRSGEPTRQKILDAAEQVIAEVGVDAATFAEINNRAGQRNNSATQYHFGDRVSLLVAMINRHTVDIAARREELLRGLDSSPTLTDLARALIEPLGTCLEHESGRRYLIIQATLLSHPDREMWPDHLARPWTRPGVDQVETRVQAVLGGADREPSADLKRELIALLMFHSLANRARQAGPDADHSGFLKGLVNALVALIDADLSA